MRPNPYTMAALATATFIAIHAHAATIYVDADATGAADGISWADAHTTLQAAVDNPAFVGGGNTILLATGTYAESVTLTAAHSGVEGLPNTIMAATGATPLFDGNGTLANALAATEADYITISGLAVQNYTGHGVSFDTCTGTTILDCESAYNGSAGLFFRASPDVLVEGCNLHHNTGAAVQVGTAKSSRPDACANIVFRRNLFHYNTYGVYFLHRDPVVRTIDHCTFYRNSLEAVWASHDGSVWVSNCVVASSQHTNDNGPVWAEGTQTYLADTLFYANGLYNARANIHDQGGNIEADPGFVDAPNGDFRYFAGSPALDAAADGSNLGASTEPAVAQPAAQTYYVRADGDDANTGLSDSPSGAFATLQQAAAIIQGGDTVLVGEGTYAGGVLVERGGSPDVPTTFRATGAAVLSGGAHGFHIKSANNIRLEGFEITAAAGHGILLEDVDGCVIAGCVATDNTLDGIRFNRAFDCLVEDSAFHANKNYGVRADGGNNNTFLRTVIYDNTSGGVYGNDNGGGNGNAWHFESCEIRNNKQRGVHCAGTRKNKDWSLTNCVVYANQTYGIELNHYNTMVLANCIVFKNTTRGITMPSATTSTCTVEYSNVFGNTLDYNLATPGEGCLSADPAFVDPVGWDFRLYENSPCAGTGANGLDMGLYPHGPLVPLPVAATYYVDPEGDDALNDGSGPALAFATIQHAVNQLVPGGTVVVLPGSYTGAVVIATSGSLGNEVTVRAEGDVTVVAEGDGITLRETSSVHLTGFTVSGATGNGIVLENASACMVSNCVVVGSTGYGLDIRTGGNHVVVDCVFSENNRGVSLQESGYNLFLRTRFQRNKTQGLYNDDRYTDGNIVRECVFNENKREGARSRGYWLFDHVVAYANASHGFATGNHANPTYSNCVAACNGDAGFTRTESTIFSSLNNCTLFANGSDHGNYAPIFATNTLSANPSFVDPWNDDFRLYADSSCIGAGAGGSNAGLYPAGGTVPLPIPATYYVSVDGDDANSGLDDTPGGAFATLAKAFETAGPSDTVVLGSGLHTSGATITTASPATRPAILRGAAGSVLETTEVNALLLSGTSNFRLENLTVTGAAGDNIRLERTAFCDITGCASSNAGYNGLYLLSTPATRVTGGRFENNTRSGIEIYSGAVCEILNVTVTANRRDGIRGSGTGTNGDEPSRNLLIRQSLVYGNTGYGVNQSVHWSPSPWFVENSVVHGNSTAAFYTRSSVNATIRNTIVTGHADIGAFRSEGADLAARFTLLHNNVYGNAVDYPATLVPDEGSISADPLYRGAASGNFKIQGDSPCVNAGINQDWMVDAFDFAGNPRIADRTVDIGAHEIASGATILILR